MKIKILSTKRLLTKEKVSELLNPRCFKLSSYNFIKIHPISIPSSQHFHPNILITSQNSLPEFQKYLQATEQKASRFSFWCVGRQTSHRLTELFHPPIEIAQNAGELSGYLTLRKNEKFSYLCGKNRLDIIPKALGKYNIDFNEIYTYETEILSQKVDVDQDAFLFFSPSAVTGFFKENQLGQRGVIFSIGQTTTAALQKHTHKKIISCRNSSIEGILNNVNNYFSHDKTY